MRDLVLTGFMGTGKTSVGQVLARRYGLEFVDLDDEIVTLTGRSVAEIFAADGETAFRELETEALRNLRRGGGRVIATGGGALISQSNAALLTPDQTVVCLKCDEQELWRRLDGGVSRPLLAAGGADRVKSLLASRVGAYARYQTVDTTGRSVDEVARVVAHHVGLSHVDTLRLDVSKVTRVHLEAGSLHSVGEVARERESCHNVLVVTDSVVADLPGIVDGVVSSLTNSDLGVAVEVLPPGEEHKTADTLNRLLSRCMNLRLDRQSAIVTVGGGVVCDVAGMAAAVYMRGIGLIQVPTTLLAQVDASIGGKVGVDFDGAKNLVGAFYPADDVIIDPAVLDTLPVVSRADGLAEVVKIACMRSPALCGRLDRVPDAGTITAYPDIIRRAAMEKIQIVCEDPRERGVRALLNFGHTIGHGLEAASAYRLSHGQAVSIGMIAETEIAVHNGFCETSVLEWLRSTLDRFNLPSRATGVDVDTACDFVAHDKKRDAGGTRVALPSALGTGRLVTVSEPDVRRAIARATGES